MDFMVNLPPSKGFDVIMVVVDQFSKIAHFVPTKESATAEKTKRLFFTHVFKHHGLLKDIVSNQRPKVHKQVLANLVEVHGVEA
jgi:hypothetical protein